MSGWAAVAAFLASSPAIPINIVDNGGVHKGIVGYISFKLEANSRDKIKSNNVFIDYLAGDKPSIVVRNEIELSKFKFVAASNYQIGRLVYANDLVVRTIRIFRKEFYSDVFNDSGGLAEILDSQKRFNTAVLGALVDKTWNKIGPLNILDRAFGGSCRVRCGYGAGRSSYQGHSEQDSLSQVESIVLPSGENALLGRFGSPGLLLESSLFGLVVLALVGALVSFLFALYARTHLRQLLWLAVFASCGVGAYHILSVVVGGELGP